MDREVADRYVLEIRRTMVGEFDIFNYGTITRSVMLASYVGDAGMQT